MTRLHDMTAKTSVKQTLLHLRLFHFESLESLDHRQILFTPPGREPLINAYLIARRKNFALPCQIQYP